jgi:hypothetical protein
MYCQSGEQAAEDCERRMSSSPPLAFASLASVLLLVSPIAHADKIEWERLAPLPEPNGGAACGGMAGRIVVAGGTNWVRGEKQWLREIHEFDPRLNTWRTRERLDEPIAYAVAATVGSELLIIGGTTGAAARHGSFVIAANRETVMDRDPAVVAILSAGGLVGHEIVWVGGTDAMDRLSTIHGRVWAWDRRFQRLRSLEPYPIEGVALAGAIAVGKELLVFGGARWDPASGAVQNRADAHAISPSRNAWRTLCDLPHPVRLIAAVPVDESRIYLAGGYRDPDHGFTDEAFIYDIKKDTYKPARPLPYRAAVALVRSEHNVYCVGGEDKVAHRTDSVYRIPVSTLEDQPNQLFR